MMSGTQMWNSPELLVVPCLGYGPAGVRLGYGGGFFDRTLQSIRPRPVTRWMASVKRAVN